MLYPLSYEGGGRETKPVTKGAGGLITGPHGSRRQASRRSRGHLRPFRPQTGRMSAPASARCCDPVTGKEPLDNQHAAAWSWRSSSSHLSRANRSCFCPIGATVPKDAGAFAGSSRLVWWVQRRGARGTEAASTPIRGLLHNGASEARNASLRIDADEGAPLQKVERSALGGLRGLGESRGGSAPIRAQLRGGRNNSPSITKAGWPVSKRGSPSGSAHRRTYVLTVRATRSAGPSSAEPRCPLSTRCVRRPPSAVGGQTLGRAGPRSFSLARLW